MPRYAIHTLPSGTALNQKELPCPILQPFFWAVHIQGLINVGAKDLAPCLIWDIFEWPFKIQSSLWDWMRPLLQWYYNFISPPDESCFPHILTGVVPKIIPQNTSCMQISTSICFLEKLFHERALPTLQNPIGDGIWACLKIWLAQLMIRILVKTLPLPSHKYLLTIPLADGPIDHLKI